MHRPGDRGRNRGTAAQRGYGARWQKTRAAYLKAHPLCRMCEAQGRTTLATVVDHIVPHRGDQKVFWDPTNWQPLCTTCHNAVKQAEERSGHVRGCDEDGNPLDPHHPWHTDARGPP